MDSKKLNIRYNDDKIIGYFSCNDKKETRHFNGMKEAVEYTRISSGYIARCIDTGAKYRCWTFDLE